MAVLREAAEDGRNLVVVTDDAYFGLFYGEDVAQESLFARLAGCHERLLAVKVDGPTKEEFVWGFRTGMLTFGARAFFSDEALYQALEKKVAGAIRSAVSNCSHVAQSVLAKAMADRRAAGRAAAEEGHSRSPGQEGPGDPQLARSTPNSGSRIPSTPATSCA